MISTNECLNYLAEQGLHDAVLDKILVDFGGKKVVLYVSNFSKKKSEEEMAISLININLLKIDQSNDFKNKEIILDFDIVDKSIRMFTVSNASYYFEFETCDVTIFDSPESGKPSGA